MRPVVVVLLSFILATSYAMSIVDQDEPYEPYEQDEPYKTDDGLEKRGATCQDIWQAGCDVFKSDCNNLFGLKYVCAKTCNACPKPCDPYKIENKACAQWKAYGYCSIFSKYFDYMKKHCTGNCGYCLGYKPPPPNGPHTVKVNIKECRDAHNIYRRKHGAPALTWDTKMAQEAQVFALKLARDKKLSHDQTIQGKYGENLASVYYSSASHSYTCKDATKAWYNEVKHYNFARPGYSSKTGHFTQVVWKASRRLGVGIAKVGRRTYVVARYSPPGNYQGQFAANVGRPVNG